MDLDNKLSLVDIIETNFELGVEWTLRLSQVIKALDEGHSLASSRM